MIRRILLAATAAATGLLAALAAAAPASAGSSVNCSGQGCWLNVGQLLNTGGTGSGPAQPPPPPPCQWDPIGDQTSGSNYIVAAYHGVNPGPSAPGQAGAAFTQAQDLLKNPVPGTWYQLALNPAAGQAAQQACQQFPLYDFAPRGHQPPVLPIPGLTLAQYAAGFLPIPQLHLRINPTAMGYVNLGTYVWQTTPVPASQSKRVAVGNQWAAVTMTSSPLLLSTDGSGTIGSHCGRNGSGYPVGKLPARTGAGVMPDCGVLWRAATNEATITGTIVWTVKWAASDGTSGTWRIPSQAQAGPISVNEIQSING
jgi:hypothetical protein